MTAFDASQLSRLLKLHGMSARKLARDIGVAKSTIDRIRYGEIDDPGGSKVIAILIALGISPRAFDTFYPSLPPYWEPFSGEDSDRIDYLYRTMSRGENSLTINVRQDVYFIPPAMLTHATAHLTTGWSPERYGEWTTWITSYRDQRREFLRKNRYRNTVVAPRSYYTSYLQHDPQLVGEAAAHISEFSDRSAVILLEQKSWNQLMASITNLLGLDSLDKLLIINDSIAYLRPSYFSGRITYHRPTVAALRKSVEDKIRLVAPDYESEIAKSHRPNFEKRATQSLKSFVKYGY